MLVLLSQRNFLLLWLAHTVSILGDYIFFLAITLWMYEQTGSALVTGLLLICSTIPAILLAPLAGKVVDHHDRQRVMFVAESARAALFLELLAAFIVSPRTLWPIYLVGFLQSALAAFFWPARSASIPRMIQPSSLLAANALYTLSDSGARIVAPALATLALLHLGAIGVVAIDAATFVISASSICFLALPAENPFPRASSPRRKRSIAVRPASLVANLRRQVKRGLPPSSRSALVRRVGGLFLLASVATYIAGTLSLLLPIFVETILFTGTLSYGWMFSAQAMGEGAMSFLLGKITPRKEQKGMVSLLSGCFVMEGVVLLLLAQWHALLPWLLLNLVFGTMTAAITIHILTDLQRRVSNRFLGRTMSTCTALQALAQVGGMGVVSFSVMHLGAVWLLLSDGLLSLLAGCLAWVLVWPQREI